MGLECKIETDLELKSPGDLFYKRLSQELHHLPNASPNMHAVEIHEGDIKTHGSIRKWTYTIEGKKEDIKERLEIDEAAKEMSSVGVGGHLMERYKSFKVTYRVIPKDNGPAIVKIMVFYEKFKETDPDLHNYLEFIKGLIKDLDEHLMANKE